MEYLCLVWEAQGHRSKTNRPGCSTPRKSTGGRQNCEYIGKTNKGHCPEGTNSEDQTCTGTNKACKLTTNCILKLHSRDSLAAHGYYWHSFDPVYWNWATAQCCVIPVKLTEFGNWSLTIPKTSVISITFSIRCWFYERNTTKGGSTQKFFGIHTHVLSNSNS